MAIRNFCLILPIHSPDLLHVGGVSLFLGSPRLGSRRRPLTLLTLLLLFYCLYVYPRTLHPTTIQICTLRDKHLVIHALASVFRGSF
jgi:hypothetical protein